MSLAAEKEPNGSLKRKRMEGGEIPTGGGEMVETAKGEAGGEMDDDLLLEDLINGAPDSHGVSTSTSSGGGQEEPIDIGGGSGGCVQDDDSSQIDLIAREILEDSQSQSQGTTTSTTTTLPYGRKKPRTTSSSGTCSPSTTRRGRGEEDSEEDEAEEEVEVLEEEAEEEDDEDNNKTSVGGKGVRTVQKRASGGSDSDSEDDSAHLTSPEKARQVGGKGVRRLRKPTATTATAEGDDDEDIEDEEEDIDVDDVDDDDGEEDLEDIDADNDQGREFRTLGAKGLFGAKGRSTSSTSKSKQRAAAEADVDDDEEDDEDVVEEDVDEDEEEEDADSGASKSEQPQHTLTRAVMDRYLDIDAKMGLLTRAVREYKAQSQVATLLTSALLQLANTRSDFAAQVAHEIEMAKEEDYDSDDETDEKVELAEEETVEGWLRDFNPGDYDVIRNNYLKGCLEMPFKAKFNGERCSVVEAVGGSLLVRQWGETLVAPATEITGAKGRNGALLAEWAKKGMM